LRTPQDKRDHPQKENAKSYVYYTGLGFQMLATIGIFAFIGYKLDQNRQGYVFTAVLTLIGVCLSLFNALRSIMKKNKP